MNHCEPFEILVSAWLDGALGRDEQIECVDHLVRCAACRRFYVDARALDGLVAAVRTPQSAAAPSPDAWQRVERAARPARRRPPTWMLQAAAVVTLAVGLYVMTWSTGRGISPAPAGDDIVLGTGGTMTDTRFIELTKEVLRAEPRYHTAMHQVLDQALRDSVPREAPSGDVAAPTFERTRQQPESQRRLPA